MARTEKDSVIVYGPQGCGKTRNAEILKKHFGVNHIIDGWQRNMKAPSFDHLILTNDLTMGLVSSRRVISYEKAMSIANGLIA